MTNTSDYMSQPRYALFLTALLWLCLVSCRHTNGSGTHSSGGDTIQMEYARHLTLIQHGTAVEAVVRNPWDTTTVLHRYLLVPAADTLPAYRPAGADIIRTPLKKALVYSAVHNSLIAELGASHAIAGVCDAAYINDPALRRRIAQGSVADCGTEQAPDMERVMQLAPDAILLSPYENSGDHGKVARMGIPLVECADYMEPTPLGRAEWMCFYGLLFGCTPQADSLWQDTRESYNNLKAVAATAARRPKVLTDRIYGSAWFMSGPQTTIGCYIDDAGGRNAFPGISGQAVVAMSPEQVLAGAADADVWLVRYNQATPMTLAQLGNENPLYRRFDAWKKQQVWGCNTRLVPYYEETPFHPQWLLADMIATLHPELADSVPAQHRYHSHLK